MLVWGPNHTQYEISLTFLWKTTFERDLRPHSFPTIRFHNPPSNCTTKQDAYNCRVLLPTSAAGKRRNDKTCLSTPSRSVIHDVRYVYIFVKVVLTTSMTPYENVVLYWVWFGPSFHLIAKTYSVWRRRQKNCSNASPISDRICEPHKGTVGNMPKFALHLEAILTREADRFVS